MRPRDIVPAPNWIALVLSLASICFVYTIFGWIGVAVMGVTGAVIVSLLTIVNRRG